MTAVTLIWLLAAVNTLVSLQVIALNKPHVTHITSERLLPRMGENMSFQMVTAAKSAIAVFTDEVLLNLRAEQVIVANIRHLHLGFISHFGGKSRLPVLLLWLDVLAGLHVFYIQEP